MFGSTPNIKLSNIEVGTANNEKIVKSREGKNSIVSTTNVVQTKR